MYFLLSLPDRIRWFCTGYFCCIAHNWPTDGWCANTDIWIRSIKEHVWTQFIIVNADMPHDTLMQVLVELRWINLVGQRSRYRIMVIAVLFKHVFQIRRMFFPESLAVQEVVEFLEQAYRQHIHILTGRINWVLNALIFLRIAYSSCGRYW